MRDIDKIQRQVHFMFAQVYDPQDAPNNNTWVYNRAPDGYVFELIALEVSSTGQWTLVNGHVTLFDGHEYTQWDIWPGVESREIVARVETNVNAPNVSAPLNGWECKEYTLGVRCTHETYAYKACIIVWYYLKKMSKLETYYYAVIQPRWKRFKKAFATTLDPKDE